MKSSGCASPICGSASGGGVPYAAYGPDLRGGIARLTRPRLIHHSRRNGSLRCSTSRRAYGRPTHPQVADLGYGSGWSSIALAGAYAAVRIGDIDL